MATIMEITSRAAHNSANSSSPFLESSSSSRSSSVHSYPANTIPGPSESGFFSKKSLADTTTTVASTIMSTSSSTTTASSNNLHQTYLQHEPAEEEPKLDLSFFGRKDDLRRMQNVYDSTMVKTKIATIPVALLYGLSGTGKSRLVQSFVEQVDNVHFLQGKLDENSGSSDPFAAIVQALNGFCDQLEGDEVARLQRRVQKTLGGGDNQDYSTTILTTLVPALSIFFANAATSVTTGSSSSSTRRQLNASATNASSADIAWNQLQYLFLQFLKAIATKERPVILFLDDLQWASQVTLDLLQHVLLDPSLEYFMCIGAIRQEHNPHNNDVLELSEDAPLSRFVRNLEMRGAKEQGSIAAPKNHVEQIRLTNLSRDQVTEWIAQVLNRHHDGDADDLLQSLSARVYKKTGGNIFFMVHTLENYQRSKMLVYSQITSQWEWNENRDTPSVSSSSTSPFASNENIIHLIASKLKALPSKQLQRTLIVAAYVRSNFDLHTLQFVLDDENLSRHFHDNSQDMKKESLASMLEQAVLEGLLSNTIGGSNYSFAHDRIQQAACGLVPYGEERHKLRLIIGRRLLDLCRHGYKKNEASNNKAAATMNVDESYLFVAANHLNSGPTKHHLFSATLNLEVGERALEVAALALASTYLQRGADAMKKVRNAWDEQYDISLRITQARANVELSLGRFELGESLGQEVLSHAKSLEEKLPTYLTMAMSLGRQDRHFEAFKTSQRVSRMLKGFPKRLYMCHLIKDSIPVRNFFNKKSNEEILRLPMNTNPKKLMTMEFMIQLSLRAFMTKNTSDWLVALFKMLRITMKYGLCPNSALAFTYYGLLMSGTGDHGAAIRFGALARKVLNVTKGKAQEGWVYCISSAYINAWKQPHMDVVRAFQRGHTSAMETGEFEIGFLNWQSCNMHAFTAGFELGPLAKDGENLIQQMKLYDVTSIYRMSVEQINGIKILTGQKPLEWHDIQSFGLNEDNNKSTETESSETYYLMCGYWLRLQIAVYFQKYEWAEQIAERFYAVSSHDESYTLLVSRTFFIGLAAAGRYRETKHKKHMKVVREQCRLLKQFTKAKGLNSLHRSLILDAEAMALTKTAMMTDAVVDKIRNKFDLAIMVAIKSGHVQDAALACELVGEIFLRAKKDEHVQGYFTQAIERYQEWGCTIKVKDLQEHRLRHIDETRLQTLLAKAKKGGIVPTVGFSGSVGGASSHRREIGFVSHAKMAGACSIAGATLKSAEAIIDENEERSDSDDISVLSENSEI